MRLAVIVVVASCRQEPDTGAFDPEDAVRESTDGTRVEVRRRKVPLEDMPIVAKTLNGLPMSGLADIDIDVNVPKHAGAPVYTKATGRIAVRCPSGCAIGDGKANLSVPGLGDVQFGQLKIDRFEARIELTNGKLDITKWELASGDLAVEARFHMGLADRFDESKLDGCLQFRAHDALLQRDPKTHAVLSTTGAMMNRDGLYSIAIGGTVGETKLIARECRVSGSPKPR